MPRKKASTPRQDPKPRDANTGAARAVKNLTGEDLPDGESLLGSSRLQKELREARERGRKGI